MPDKNENLPEKPKCPASEETALNNLFSISEVLASNRYMTLDNERELNIYVVYMTYRVEHDLYELYQENGQFRDLSWDDFVTLLQGNIPARAAAIVVVHETLNNFYRSGHYNFDATEINWNYGADVGDDETGYLHCASLFSVTKGFGLVENLLFHAELAQYACQLNQKAGCSWDQFLDELQQKGPLWSQILAGFRDALARLDFKPMWKSENLEELVLQAAAEEE